MKFILNTLLVVFLFSCGSTPPTTILVQATGPQAIVYKTTNDYFNQVPVLLSDDKKQILSYPDPSDLVYGDKLAYPTKLNRGYLLDNRGIGENVAFLKLTYDEYSQLNTAPSPAELYKLILDTDPIIEMWDCGLKNSYSDIKAIKKVVRAGFTDCEKVK